MQKCVFVLGMARSGTSAAARLIELLGVHTPVEHDVIQASVTNPKGVFESKSLIAFNRRVLSTVGNDERFPSVLEPGWELDSRLAPAREDAAAAVREVFPETPWVWKDPLHCLTFAFWHRFLDVEPVVVLMHRNPLEIASSWQRAWGQEKIYGLALWERYLRQALNQITSLPVLVTAYEDVVSEPLVWSKQMHAFLSEAGVPVESPREADVREFVDARLRHVEFTRADLLDDREVSEAQKTLAETVVRLAGPHEAFIPPELPGETPTTEALLFERRKTFQIKDEMERLLEAERQSRWGARLRRSRYAAPARPIYRRARRFVRALGIGQGLPRPIREDREVPSTRHRLPEDA